MKTRPSLSLLAVAACATLALSGTPPPAAERIRADVARLAAADWEGRRAGSKGADARPTGSRTSSGAIGLGPARPTAPSSRASASSTAWCSARRTACRSGRRASRRRGRAAARLLGRRRVRGRGGVRGLRDRREGRRLRRLRRPRRGRAAWSCCCATARAATIRIPMVGLHAAAPQGGERARARRGGRAGRDGAAAPGAGDELVSLRADAALVDAGIPAFSVRRAVAEALFAGSARRARRRAEVARRERRPAPRALAVRVRGPGRRRARAPRRATWSAWRVRPRRNRSWWAPTTTTWAWARPPRWSRAPRARCTTAPTTTRPGSAALVELARALAPRAAGRAAASCSWRSAPRSWALLGSSHFVKEPPVPLERVAACSTWTWSDGCGRQARRARRGHQPGLEAALGDGERGAGLKLNFKRGRLRAVRPHALLRGGPAGAVLLHRRAPGLSPAPRHRGARGRRRASRACSDRCEPVVTAPGGIRGAA